MSYRNIEIPEKLYVKISELAKKEGLSIDELLQKFLNKDTDYSKFANIKLEETGLFNYKGGQSCVYNRFLNSNITTLKELFEADESNRINFGDDKFGENYHIHAEIKGIISLLKYKYLEIFPEELNELLNFKINTANLLIPHMPSYSHTNGYPGKVFKAVHFRGSNRPNNTSIFVNEFYKTLKSCGFDQSSTKALIDVAFENKVSNVSLGEFLFNLNVDEMYRCFSKVPQEHKPFFNILNILLECYKERFINEKSSKSL